MKFLFILFLPFMLFAQQANNTEKVPPNESAKSEKLSEEDKQLKEQKELVKNVVENINNKTYLDTLNAKEILEEKLALLKNKININERANNTLAVKRDKLEVTKIEDKIVYEDTLKKIIKAKEEFRELSYYKKLLNTSLEKIQDEPLSKYKKAYEEHKNYTSYISEQFTKNYEELDEQRHKHLLVLNYLKDNIQEYRKTNFFIDEFNLKYLINKIDSISGVSYISNLTSYHFKFSVGEIVVVLFIILIIRLISLKVIYLVANLIARIFIQRKSDEDDTDEIREYLKESINTPLIYSLYVLAIQISVYILVKDPVIVANIMPWINTIYMALFTWGLYAIINNSINNYALTLLEKYPNVRKEMIVFILKVVKVVLVLLVILFLFSQLGIDIKAIAASLGVGGIAIALASKDTLTNFFGSLSIMTDNSFSQGDWIKTGDIEGTVVDIRMRTTRIRTFDNGMITVPNSHLANTHITNWSKRKIGRRIYMKIGITYESKMEDIVNLKNDIREMLENHPRIATEQNSQIGRRLRFEAIEKEALQGIMRTLLVYVDEYSSSSINIMVYCFGKNPSWEEWLKTKEDVIVKIAELVKKNNCEFAYPTQTLWMKNNEISDSELKSNRINTF